MSREDQRAGRCKPTTAQLGVNLETLAWQRSGAEDGSFEVAFVAGAGPAGVPGRAAAALDRAGVLAPVEWVLVRVAGDPASRVLIYDRVEWRCFLDGARSGEFDPENQGLRAPLRTDRHSSNLCAERPPPTRNRSASSQLPNRYC
jgi:hypothetical protein